MTGSKYYTHFIADTPQQRGGGEWSAVIELSRPLHATAEARELAQVLAKSLDLEAKDICILDWSRLH